MEMSMAILINYYKSGQMVLHSMEDIKNVQLLQSRAWWQIICPWKLLRSWIFITIKWNKKLHPSHRPICVTCKLVKHPSEYFLNWKMFLLSSWKISSTIPIKGSDFSNVVAEILL